MTSPVSAKFSFGIESDTSGADSAVSSLENIKSSIEEDTFALREMQKAFRNLKGSTQISKAELNAFKDRVDAQKNSIALAQKKYNDLGGTFKKTLPIQKEQVKSWRELLKEAKGMPGPMGRFSGILENATKNLTASRVSAYAVAAGFVAAGAGAAYMAAKLTKLGISASDERRSEGLLLEGLTKIKTRWRLTADSAAFLQHQLDQVSASSGQSRSVLYDYERQLYKMGLRSGSLQAALQGVATVLDATGDAGQADLFAQRAAGAAMFGQSVKKLAAGVEARFGKTAQAMRLGIGVQITKLKENFRRMFDGWKIDGILTKLQGLFSIFNQTNAAGRGLRKVFETLFKPILSAIEYVIPRMQAFFEGVIISVLELRVLFHKVRLAIRDAFGGWKPDVGAIEDYSTALEAGKVVAYALAGAFTFLAIKVGIALTPILLVGAALWAIYDAGKTLLQIIQEVGTWLGDMAFKLDQAFLNYDWSGLGLAITNGIVNGLKSGVNFVVNFVASMGSKVAKAFKDALGIKSPSKVFAGYGTNITAGLSVGMKKGFGGVAKTSFQLGQVASNNFETAQPNFGVSPAQTTSGQNSVAQAKQNTSRSPAPARGASIRIENLIVKCESSDPKQIAVNVKEALEDILEGVAIQMGAA